MEKSSIYRWISLLLATAFVLTACASAGQPANPSPLDTIIPTGASSTSSNATFLTGEEARAALEQLKTSVLMIPEGTQRWQLRSVQIPDAEEGSPYLFTYVDGERVILLIQVHGEKLSLQPVGTAVATLSGTRNVRGGIEAFYTETTLEKGKAIELAWNEDDLVVSLRSEQVDLDTLAGIADVLIYSNPSLTSTTEPVHNQVNQ